MWFGPREQGLAVLQPLLDLNPVGVHIETTQWATLLNSVLGGSDEQTCIPGAVRNTYSGYGRQVSAGLLTRSFSRLTNFWHQHPTGAGTVAMFRHLGRGRAASIPLDATAYAWRDQTASM